MKKMRKRYDFPISMYERQSLIWSLTGLFVVLDFMMIYPAMQAGETTLTWMRQINIFMQALAVVLLIDLPTGMLGEAISKFFNRKMIRKAALAASGLLLAFLVALYGQVCMLKLESAKLSAQTTTSISRFENTNEESSVLDSVAQQSDNAAQAAQIAEQKEAIAEKTAAVTNILPLANSVFLIILSGAGAKKRKLIRLSDREQELFEQRNRLIEQKELYQALATEEQLIASDELAMQDMIHRVNVFVNTWKRDVLFSAVAQQQNSCYAADMLRAADMDSTNNQLN